MTAMAAALVWIPNTVMGHRLSGRIGGQEQEHDAEDMHRAVPGVAMIFDVIRKLPPKI